MNDESEKDSVQTEHEDAKTAAPTGAVHGPEPSAGDHGAVQPQEVPPDTPVAEEPVTDKPVVEDGEPAEDLDDGPDPNPIPAEAPTPIAPVLTLESLSTALEETRGQLVALRRESERSATSLSDTQARLRAVSKAYREQQEEMEGFRKRLETQSKYKLERQAFDAVAAFLDPVQNLRRSIENAEGLSDGLLQGLQMVESQFSDAMTRLGLEPVPGVGAPFDPTIHEALAVAPVTDPEQDGKILIVHAEGFMIAGKVLEASKVVIGKYTAEALEEA